MLLLPMQYWLIRKLDGFHGHGVHDLPHRNGSAPHDVMRFGRRGPMVDFKWHAAERLLAKRERSRADICGHDVTKPK